MSKQKDPTNQQRIDWLLHIWATYPSGASYPDPFQETVREIASHLADRAVDAETCESIAIRFLTQGISQHSGKDRKAILSKLAKTPDRKNQAYFQKQADTITDWLETDEYFNQDTEEDQ